jgi:hypothetical protein
MKRRRKLPKILTQPCPKARVDIYRAAQEAVIANGREVGEYHIQVFKAAGDYLGVSADGRPIDEYYLSDLLCAALEALFPISFGPGPRGRPNNHELAADLLEFVNANKATVGFTAAIAQWAKAHKANPKTARRRYYLSKAKKQELANRDRAEERELEKQLYSQGIRIFWHP